MKERKKIFTTLFVIVTIVVALVPLSDRFLDEFVRRKNYQRLAYDAFNDKTEVVIIGSSRISNGINPSSITRPTMSITVPFATYQHLNDLWSHLSKRAPNLKLALIEWDIVMLAGPYGKFSPDFAPQSANYRYYEPVPARAWFSNPSVAFRAAFPSLSEIRLTPRYFQKTYFGSPGREDSEYFKFAGFIPSESNHRSSDSPEDRHRRLNERFRFNVVEDQTNSLIEILKDLKSKNITYQFMRMPVNPKVRETKFEDWEFAYKKAEEKVIQATGMPMNFLELNDNEFNENDFNDSDHMNKFGAEKLTKQLDARLR